MNYKFYLLSLFAFVHIKCMPFKDLNTYKLSEIGIVLNLQNIAFIDTIYGSHEKIYGYHLKDSAIFYLGKGRNFYYNGDNISKSIEPFTIQSTQSSNNTLELKGLDINQKYWKHKIIGKYFIGYTNVPMKRRRALDKIINKTKKTGDFE